MIRRTVLPGGVVVITEAMEQWTSAAVDFWIGVGSRMETSENNGLAHFFEHAVFKGTQQHTPLELVKAIERKGGMLNASTTRERTHFYARTAASELMTAIDTIGEMLTSSRLSPKEMVLEREVILEEIRGVNDLPDELAYDLFCEAQWGREGLGLPIAGTLGSVRKLGAPQLNRHRQEVMERWPVVVTAAGKLDHDEVCDRVRQVLSSKKKTVKQPIAWQPNRSEIKVVHRDVQQGAVVLGTAIPLRREGEGIALGLIHLLLGEGMSSRLFQRVREDRGLVYFIQTGATRVAGGGSFTVMFGSEPEKGKAALEEIARELETVRREGFSSEEIEMGKEMMEGGMRLSAEMTSDRSNALARWEFLGRKPEGLEERIAKVQRVTPGCIDRMVRELLVPERWGGAAVLPLGQRLDLRRGLRF